MITLVTGGTGDGKTAMVVQMMLNEYQGRPLFVMGIQELKVPHFPVPPVAEWTEEVPMPEDPTLTEFQFRFPENAVIIVDEAQKVFRPRHVSAKVPPEVQAFETHRHEGIDWVLITQDPKLIDINVKRLVKRHIHIWPTHLGRYRLEHPKAFDPEDKAERDIAARSKYSPPKSVFGLYKSARAHTTVKRSIPRYVYVAGLSAAAAIGLGIYAYGSISAKISGSQTANLESLKNPGSPGQHQVHGSPDKQSRAEYLAQIEPRIPGMYHTASRYDEVTKPTDAPWPAVCVETQAWNGRPARCRCLDQQGNDYQTTEGVCSQIAHHGIFKDWQGKGSDGRPEADRPKPEPAYPIKEARFGDLAMTYSNR